MAYSALNFINDFIAYSKANLNTLITASNTQYDDTLLKQISTTAGYIYSNEDEIDQKRAEAIAIYNTPKAVSISSVAYKSAITREWNFGIAYAEGARDTDLQNLNKLMRYEQCLQKLIQNYFNSCSFATPEITGVEYKDISGNDNIYKYVTFNLQFTIAGA